MVLQEAETSFCSISGSAAFLALPLAPLLALLASDRLAVSGEMQVWDAAAAWVQHAPGDRAKHLTCVMGAPRLPREWISGQHGQSRSAACAAGRIFATVTYTISHTCA